MGNIICAPTLEILEQGNDKKAIQALEVFCLRFPNTSGNIFKIIDDQSLAECKGINRTLDNSFTRKDSIGSGSFRNIGET